MAAHYPAAHEGTEIKTLPADDRDERLLHRLEAFSDIVIGFSLAQVTLSLSPATFFDHSKYWLTFVATYAAVSIIWWMHNRLFARYFVPNAMGIVLNFIALGAMILFVFSTQVVMTGSDPRGLPLYFGSYGTVYLMLGTLYLLGSRERRAALSTLDYRLGVRRGARTLVRAAFPMLLIVLGFSLVGLHVRTVGYVIVIPLAAGFLTMRIIERIWPDLQNPKGPAWKQLLGAAGRLFVR